MGTTTRLALPYPGASDAPAGHTQLQALAEALDNAVLHSRGTYASRPAATIAGRVHQQTDTAGGLPAGTYTMSNGTTWDVLMLGGTIAEALVGSSGTPATANPFLTEDDAGVMHIDKARTVTALHTFTQAPRHGVTVHVASATLALNTGKVQTFAGSSGQTLTVPAGTVGDEAEVLNIDAADSVTLARTGSNTFNGATTFVIPAGSTAKLNFVATNTWAVRLTSATGIAATGSITNDQLDATALGAWRTVESLVAQLGNSDGTAQRVAIRNYGISTLLYAGSVGDAENGYGIFGLNEANYRGDTDRDVEVRVTGTVLTGTTDPTGVTASITLDKVTGLSGLSVTGVSNKHTATTATLNANEVEHITPGAVYNLSADGGFGTYICRVNVSGTLPAGAVAWCNIRVEVREQ